MAAEPCSVHCEKGGVREVSVKLREGSSVRSWNMGDLVQVPQSAEATLEEADRSIHLDPRLLNKPEVYDGNDEHWLSWRFEFLNWVSVIEPRFAALLPSAEQRDDPVISQTGELWRLQVTLYGLLSSYFGAADRQLISQVAELNGFEAFRRL